MLSEHLEPVTHLAGLHILASFIYCRRRDQDEISQQLNEAGLYELALTLLKIHSQFSGLGKSSTHTDTLHWLEASQMGSPMGPLPDEQPVSWEPKGNMGPLKGNFAQHSPRSSFQPDPSNPSSRPHLTTAQTLPPPNLHSAPATTGHSPLLCQTGGTTLCDEEEANDSTAQAGNAGVTAEEDLEGISGEVTLADQVVLAALEVLFKLASDPHHLQALRYGRSLQTLHYTENLQY